MLSSVSLVLQCIKFLLLFLILPLSWNVRLLFIILNCLFAVYNIESLPPLLSLPMSWNIFCDEKLDLNCYAYNLPYVVRFSFEWLQSKSC